MATLSRSKIFNSPKMDSRIKSANTKASEIWLGYFAGPMLLYMAYYSIAGAYLTQFYTDVLGLAGGFLTLMPIISKVIDAITNIIMGRIIDKTRTRQGKSRPWVLISGFLIAVTGCLLYAVPRASYQVQIVWIVVSYNLFFAFAFTIYNMSHTLMVPLSTRNTKQRDTLALVQNAGMNMLPGLLTSVIMPFLVATFGVGRAAQGNWMMFMSILSILALPATLLEYFFTKERITEDEMAGGKVDDSNAVPFMKQIAACFKDRYWLIIMGFITIYEIANILQTNSMIYYCNWVLADSVDGGKALQASLNALGQAPLGIGVFVLWPLVNKFGKRRVMQVGFVIAALGSLGVLLAGSNFGMVIGCMMLKSVGAIPTMVMAAMMAESLDHVEWKNGYRADGFSSAVRSIIFTVGAGIGQTIILGGIASRGYIVPESSAQIIQQPDAMRSFFSMCFAGAPLFMYIIGAILMFVFDVEKKIPQISADITARHKAEAEARGEVYYSPEEKAAMEQAEQDRKAEENRIKELKEKCARKGLDFNAEEAKYQAKMAEKKAKEEAKAAKKKKK